MSDAVRAGAAPGAAPGTAARRRRYQGLSAEQRAARRRAAILDAALALFGTDGYHATPVKRICRRAQLTERYFYESFRDREACLAALYDEIVEGMRAAVADALAGLGGPGDTAGPGADGHGADPDSATAAVLAAFVHHLTDDPRRARVVLVEVVGVSPEMERRRHAVLSAFTELVLAVWGRGGPLPPRARLTAVALVGGVNHLLVDWLMGGRRDEPDELAASCAALFAAARRTAP